MDQEKLWATFQKTGRVEDYLRYCGIDIGDSAVNRVSDDTAKETSHEADNRRLDRSGKQQYR